MNLNTIRFQGIANESQRITMQKEAERYLHLPLGDILSIREQNHLIVDYKNPKKLDTLKDNFRLLKNLLFKRPYQQGVLLVYEFKNKKHRTKARNKLKHLSGGRLLQLLGYQFKDIRLQNLGTTKAISYINVEKK